MQQLFVSTRWAKDRQLAPQKHRTLSALSHHTAFKTTHLLIGSLGKPSFPMVHPAPLEESFCISTTCTFAITHLVCVLPSFMLLKPHRKNTRTTVTASRSTLRPTVSSLIILSQLSRDLTGYRATCAIKVSTASSSMSGYQAPLSRYFLSWYGEWF